MNTSLICRFAVTFLLIGLTIAGCSSDSGSSGSTVGPEPDLPKAADYFFSRDTSQIMVMRFNDSRGTYEPFVNWEEIIGEPFIDRDGNGIYERHVDTFIISSDQRVNQDLNYNGQHDGPENMTRYEWERGIPFDDLDGNRTMRYDYDFTSPDCAFAPFIDWNGNGVWDSVVHEGFFLGHWYEQGDDVVSVNLFSTGIDSAYYFLSDSGKAYWFSGTSSMFPGSDWSPDFGVVSGYIYLYGFVSSGIYLPLTNSAFIVEHQSERIETYWGDNLERHTKFLSHFETDNGVVDEVLHVRFDSLRTHEDIFERLRDASWDLYFVKGVGLIQADVRCRDYYGVMREQHFVILEKFTGTFPLPLTKVDRPQ